MSRINSENTYDIDGITREIMLSQDFSIPISSSDIYVRLTGEDRLDLLSFQFYGDPSLWWVIAKANDLKTIHNISEDKIIRIPTDINSAIQLASQSKQNAGVLDI